MDMQTTREYKPVPNDIEKIVKSDDITFSVAEIQGARDSQEDDYTFNLAADFKNKLNDTYRYAALRSTFQELNDICKAHEAGSTACMTIGWLEDKPGSENKTLVTYTAYLGDSSTFCQKK